MKPRHILPFVPIIGLLWIFWIGGWIWEEKYISRYEWKEWIWGGEDALNASAVMQGVYIYSIMIYFFITNTI